MQNKTVVRLYVYINTTCS